MKSSKNKATSLVMIALSCISFSLSGEMTPFQKEEMIRTLRTQKAKLLAIGQPITFTHQAVNFENLKEFISRDLEGIRRDVKALAESQRVLIEIIENM